MAPHMLRTIVSVGVLVSLVSAGRAQPALTAITTLGADDAQADDARVDAPDPFAAHLRDGAITRGFVRHRVLHFTFDDGPRLDTTPVLLDHLDRYGVKATFFVVARGFDGRNRVDRAKADVVRDIAARGHLIGNHTFDHARLTDISDEAVIGQLVRSEKILTAVLGDRPWLFRAPFGARDARVDALVSERGYTHVLWNTTSGDVTHRTAEGVLEEFRASLERRERHPRGAGGIVLLHDTKPWVVEAFPSMMEELRARNCALLADEDEELWDVLPDPSVFHQERGEDASRQARTVELDPEWVAARQQVLRAEAHELCQPESDAV